MCRLSWNLGASIFWNLHDLPRPVMGFLLPLILSCRLHLVFQVISFRKFIQPKSCKHFSSASRMPHTQPISCSNFVAITKHGGWYKWRRTALHKIPKSVGTPHFFRPQWLPQEGIYPQPDCCWIYILSPVHPVSALWDVEAIQGTSHGACLLLDVSFCIWRYRKGEAVAAETVKACGGLETQLHSLVNLTNSAPVPHIPGTVSMFQGNVQALGHKSTIYIMVTLYWGYLIVLWLFHLVCVLYCVCFNLFCNVWVRQYVWVFW
jgi:hypothetical protein